MRPQNRETAPGFRRISAASREEHVPLVGLLAYSYCPAADPAGRLAADLVPLESLHMATCRPQWRQTPNGPVQSVIFSLHGFRHDRPTGRVLVDAGSNVDAWEATRVRQGGAVVVPPRYLLDPRDRAAACRTASALYHTLRSPARADRVEEDAPAFPPVLYAFPANSPPAPERTTGLLAAARADDPALAGLPDAAIPDGACVAAFERRLSADGARTYAPQWLFARDPGDLPVVHPRDGSSRPTAAGTEGAIWGGWAMLGGVWVPRMQLPVAALADVSGLLGRESTAAWEVLVAAGHLPAGSHAAWAAGCTDEAWAAFVDETLARLFPTRIPVAENQHVREWRRLAGAGPDEVADDEILAAFADARRPLVTPGLGRIGVVRLHGGPRPESMQFRDHGFEADLFAVRPDKRRAMEPTPFVPANPQPRGRGRRREHSR